MKQVTLKNKLNGERFVCMNTRDVEVIDGVEYLKVRRHGQDRTFLMRKETLEKVQEQNSRLVQR